MEYTIDYFINKFENILEEEWTDIGRCKDDLGRYCALGHCKVKSLNSVDCEQEEPKALLEIMNTKIPEEMEGWMYTEYVTRINDGYLTLKYGTTPKQRILNRLREIKNQTEQ